MRYLFDTNAVIYLLSGKGKFPEFTEEDEIILSFINKIELLSHCKSKKEEINITKFIDTAEIIMINNQLIDLCIGYRKERNIKLPDAIIAATAKIENSILITADAELIKKVNDITCINPLAT